MRITNNGGMTYCRWADKNTAEVNIRDVDPQSFFQQHMAGVRTTMLQGEPVDGCNKCYQMEEHRILIIQKFIKNFEILLEIMLKNCGRA